MSRITSYNVCYTKLLRGENPEENDLWFKYKIPETGGGLSSTPFDLVKFGNRITSYNVCYTKLLRLTRLFLKLLKKMQLKI